MADILLAHSNHIYADKKQAAKMQPYPPLQTLMAASTLESAGFDVALYDPTFDASSERFREVLTRHRPRRLVVCEDDFNFITKMCLVQNRELAFSMAAVAMEQGIPAYVHGSDSTDHASEYLGAGFQGVLIGEVEDTLVELARGDATEQIAGLAYRCARGTRSNSPRTLRPHLDEFSPPAWRHVDVEQYRTAWTSAHGYFSVNLVTSRGCPYRCNWCAKPVFGSHYRVHSPHRAAADLRYMKESFAPQQVWFADDIFALSPRWTRQFADAVDRLDAHIPFKMQSRSDLMTRDTVEALQQAGCSEVWMGAESGSQRILDAMDKDIRVEEIYSARENLRAHGIRACFFLQFGYLGETWEDIERTVRLVRATAPDDVGISVSYPMPGTKFYQIVSSQIERKSNWRDSADLAMMFRGEFPTEFYRALATALHAEVRKTGDAGAAWTVVEQLRASQQVAVA